jgi:hypothetical protein
VPAARRASNQAGDDCSTFAVAPGRTRLEGRFSVSSDDKPVTIFARGFSNSPEEFPVCFVVGSLVSEGLDMDATTRATRLCSSLKDLWPDIEFSFKKWDRSGKSPLALMRKSSRGIRGELGKEIAAVCKDADAIYQMLGGHHGEAFLERVENEQQTGLSIGRIDECEPPEPRSYDPFTVARSASGGDSGASAQADSRVADLGLCGSTTGGELCLEHGEGEHSDSGASNGGLKQPARLSARELAEKYGVSCRTLRGRLDRWREKNLLGYYEIQTQAVNEPRFLYDEQAVLSVISSLQAKRATNGQRK